MNDKWKKLNSQIFKDIKDVKLQWLQYRIIHRILGTNLLLFKMKIQNNDKCTFCNTESETIEHLFYDCIIVSPIWEIIVSWLNEKLSIELQIERHEYILGILHSDKRINLIIMLVKSYIYKQKCRKVLPCAEGAKQEILYYKRLEKDIFARNQNLKMFYKKWVVFD